MTLKNRLLMIAISIRRKMTYKQYHDAVLRENMMPVEMIRAILTNQPPGKDFSTGWRFYKLDK